MVDVKTTADEATVKYAPLWAKEITLTSLVTQSSKGNQLLANIAKNVSKDDKATEALIAQLKILATATEEAGDREFGSLNESKKLQASTKDLRSSLMNTAESIGRLASLDSNGFFGNIGRSFENLAGGLARVNPPLAALAGVAAEVAQVFNMVWQRGTLAANGVLDMYDAGIVFTGGIGQFMHGMSDTGLTLQQFGKMLTKNGQVVATMGIARTMQLGKAFTELTNNGSNLGMNFEQAQEVLMSYSEQQRLSGRLAKMSNDELLSGAEKYGHELNRLSQVTGQRREQIDAEIQQNRKKPSLQVLLSTLNDAARESAGKGFDHLQVMGKEMGSTMQDLIVAYKTGGMPAMLATNENMTQMLNQSGAMNQFMDLANNSIAGNSEAMDANIIAIGNQTREYARNHAVFNMLGGAMQEQVQGAAALGMSAQAVAQNLNKTGEALPSPEDAQKIADAQKAIDKSLMALNNQFTILAANVLLPLIDVGTYVVSSLRKLGENLYSLLAWTGLVDAPKDANGNATSASSMTIGEMVTAGVASLLGLGLLSKIVKGAFGIMKSMGGGLLKPFLSGGSMLKSLFSGEGILKSLLPSGGREAAAGAAGGAAKGGGSMLGSLGGLGKSAGDALRGIGTFIKDGITSITGTLASVLKTMGGVLKDGITGISSIIKTVATDLASVIGAMGKSLGTAIGGLSKGIGAAIGSLGGGIGKAIAALGGGLGKGGGALFAGIMQGMAAGLKAFANPQILVGAAILSGSIAIIGAGIAGATWIMGKAMPTLAEGLEAFTKVDGEKLQSTGMGMIKIGAGLIAMGVGEVASVWGSLASGIASFFSEDPITKLGRFGELSEPLGKAADAMTRFAEVYPKSMAAINNAVFDTAAMDSLDKLKELFAGDGFFASIGTWLAGDSDFITKLNNLGESTANLPTFASRITGFADAYTYLVQAFNEPISTEALANLVGLTDLVNRQAAANTPGLLGSIFGSTPDEPASVATQSAAVQAAGAKVAATPVDKKHKDMMEILTKIDDHMKDLLTVEDRQTRVMSDGFSRVSGVVH